MRQPTSEEIIIITAARPGLWFRERMPRGWKRILMEKLGPEEYQMTMEELRGLDDRLNEWTNDLEDLIKKTKKFKKNKVLDAGRVVEVAQLLTNINSRLKDMVESGRPLEQAHEHFLNDFQGEVLDSEKVATAGFLSDFWESLKREWLSERLLTKEEKKRNQERKRAIIGLVGSAETVLNSVKKKLKKLEEARVSGKIGEYITVLREISVLQQGFESEFASVYNTHLKPIADKAMERHQMQNQMEEEIEERGLESGPSWAESDEVISLDPDDEDVMIEDEVEVPLMPGAHEELSQRQAPVQKDLDLELEFPEQKPEPKPAKKTVTKKKTTKKKSPAKKKTTKKTTTKKKAPSKKKTTKRKAPSVKPEETEVELSPEELSRRELEQQRQMGIELSRQNLPEVSTTASDLQRIVLRTRHQKFLNELIKAAKEYQEPYILGAMISKYAQQVGGIDSETKLKLLSIVKEILDEQY